MISSTNVKLVHKQIYWIQQTFEGSNLQMLNVTFEMSIPHYIMEYVGNLCNPCLLREQPKGIVGHTRLLYVCLVGKYFAGNFRLSACINKYL